MKALIQRYYVVGLFWRQLYRTYRKLRFRHLDLPIVFGNSLPKSGTHLLMQILQGIALIGPFWERGTFVYNRRPRTDARRSPQSIVRDIHALLPGEIACGHVYATPENVSALIRPSIVNYFIYRDPRDVVVSHAFYVTDIARRNRLHRYYTQVLNNVEERITTSILGAPDETLEFPDIRSRCEPYLGWLELEQVMSIRFEDLVHDRERVIGRILDHFQTNGCQLALNREAAIEALTRGIHPAQSPTFREGKTGGWRRHFTDEHKALFKGVAGDLLVRLGYEKDLDW